MGLCAQTLPESGVERGAVAGRRPGIWTAAAVFMCAACSSQGEELSGAEISRYLQGRTALLQGEFDDALDSLAAFHEGEHGGRVDEVLVYSGLLAGRYEEAAAAADAIAEGGREAGWSYVLLRYADLARAGSWQDALALVVDLPPGFRRDLLAAWAEHHLGDIEVADRRLQQYGLSLEPAEGIPASAVERQRLEGRHALYHRALMHASEGRQEEAVALLRTSVSDGVFSSRAIAALAIRPSPDAVTALRWDAVSRYPAWELFELLLLGAWRARGALTPRKSVSEAMLSLAELSALPQGSHGALVPLAVADALLPRNEDTVMALASSFLQAEMPDRALELLRDLPDPSRRVRVAIADVLQRKGDPEAAIKVFEGLLARDPREPWLALRLAGLHERRGDYSQAVDLFTASIDAYRQVIGDLSSLDGLSEVFGEGLPRFEPERTAPGRWMDRQPGAAEGLFRLAREATVLSAAGRAEAIRLLAAYMRMEGVLWRAYFGRGIGKERQGLWDEADAESDFRTALALSGGDPDVANYLGYTWVDRNVNLEEAKTLLDQALAKRPDSDYIIDSVAWAHYRAGEYEAALALLERALQLNPTNAEVFDHYGDVLDKLGFREEAVYQWRRALTLDPSDVVRERAERKIDRSSGWRELH